jgi:hypothetical protein
VRHFETQVYGTIGLIQAKMAAWAYLINTMLAVSGVETDFVRGRTASARLMPSGRRSSLGGSNSRAV